MTMLIKILALISIVINVWIWIPIIWFTWNLIEELIAFDINNALAVVHITLRWDVVKWSVAGLAAVAGMTSQVMDVAHLIWRSVQMAWIVVILKLIMLVMVVLIGAIGIRIEIIQIALIFLIHYISKIIHCVNVAILIAWGFSVLIVPFSRRSDLDARFLDWCFVLAAEGHADAALAFLVWAFLLGWALLPSLHL